ESYNGLGQLISQAFNGSATVQYVYNQMAGGENNSRLRAMIYPNGRILDYTDSPNQQPVTSLSSAATVATVTTAAADGLSAGDKVVIEGAGAPYDGVFTVATVITSTQFTYMLGSSFTGSSSGT